MKYPTFILLFIILSVSAYGASFWARPGDTVAMDANLAQSAPTTNLPVSTVTYYGAWGGVADRGFNNISWIIDAIRTNISNPSAQINFTNLSIELTLSTDGGTPPNIVAYAQNGSGPTESVITWNNGANGYRSNYRINPIILTGVAGVRNLTLNMTWINECMPVSNCSIIVKGETEGGNNQGHYDTSSSATEGNRMEYHVTYDVIQESASFISPSPANGSRNNTPVTFNISSSNNYFFLWMSSDLNFTSSDLVINNQTSANGSKHYKPESLADGTYYLQASAEYPGVNTSILTWTYDTSAPVVVAPESPMIISAGTYNISINSTHPNIFSWNLTCVSVNTTYSTQVTGVDLSEFDANLSVTLYENDEISCSYRVCDGHTANAISGDAVSKNSSATYFRWKNKYSNLLSVENASLNTGRSPDRFTFTAVRTGVGSTDQDFVFHYRTSPNSYYIPSSEYKGWIVDADSETWLDFNSDKIISAQVFQISPGYWEIRVRATGGVVLFRSTGELNCVSGSFTIQELSDTPENIMRPGRACPTTQDDWIPVIVLILLGVLLMMAQANYIRVPIFGGVLGIVIIIFGGFFITCSLSFGLLIIMAGFVYMMKEVFG